MSLSISGGVQKRIPCDQQMSSPKPTSTSSLFDIRAIEGDRRVSGTTAKRPSSSRSQRSGLEAFCREDWTDQLRYQRGGRKVMLTNTSHFERTFIFDTLTSHKHLRRSIFVIFAICNIKLNIDLLGKCSSFGRGDF